MAIRDCLDYCEFSPNVLTGLAYCMNRLQSNGWAIEDIRVVESRVLRILKNLIAIENQDRRETQRIEQTTN